MFIYWWNEFCNYQFYYLVHPCDEANNGGCGQVCNKKNEKHECSCEAGFVLKEDKKTCKKGILIRYICMRDFKNCNSFVLKMLC